MLSLPELQQGFGEAMRDRQAPVTGIRDHGLDPAGRLQIYRNNMQSAHLEALRAAYPVSERLVGPEFFSGAAHEYLKSNPSRSGNIQDYGEAFPEFLRDFPPAASLPYLGDVAMLEWQRLQTALASSHTPMDLAALAAVPSELQPELHFSHQLAARTVHSRYPILSIWEFCQSEDPRGELDLDLPGEWVLFARPRLDVYMRRLSAGEYCFLQALFRGATFEAACREALEADSGFDVEKKFAELVQEQILTGFHL
jgi:hypothetical protein